MVLTLQFTSDRVHDDEYPTIDVVPRAEFLRQFGREYKPGQHVTFIAPTQRGKTTLCLDMLGVVISPAHKCVILSGKPPKRDATMTAAAKKLNLRVIEEWPPGPSLKDRRNNGYVLRPHQAMKGDSLEDDEANLKKQFRNAIMANYGTSKPVITVADEAYHVQINLKLKKEYEAPLLRGAPHNAMWSLLQRGAWTSQLAYDAPEHILIGFDPDKPNVERYVKMMGGVDPRYAANVIAGLQRKQVNNGQTTVSEFLYVKRSGEMFVVSTD